MRASLLPDFRVSVVTAALLVSQLVSLTGCKARPAPPTDAALASSIQSQIGGDSALAGLPVSATVVNGVATLYGSVRNDAQRTIAARDAAGVAGVKEVINTLSMYADSPVAQNGSTPMPAPIPPLTPPTHIPAPTPPARAAAPAVAVAPTPREHQPAPIERTYSNPPAEAYQPPPQAPPVLPRATFREVTLPAGTTLPIRITQTLDSATTQTGDAFSGVVAADILTPEGTLAIAGGTAVSGQVDEAADAAHFKGSSLLTVSLSSLTRRGEHLSISTEPYSVKGKGRGANTAEKTGGGAAVGAILGGIFGGGKGAAIGAGAGAGVGAGANAITRGQQVQIESESVVRFKTSSPITLRVRAESSPNGDGSGLQPRN